MTPPAPAWCGWKTLAVVQPLTDSDDGDTITVDVTREFTLRIERCWCAEVSTREPEEKKLGIAAREYLRKLLDRRGYEVRVEIKADPGSNIGDRTSMGRFVADVFVRPLRKGSRWQSVAKLMCRAGHAWPTKAAQEAAYMERGIHGRYVNKRSKEPDA